jgi:hypothetical protein
MSAADHLVEHRRRDMSAADHLGTYAEGWTKGDANTILKAVSDDYTFDDPNAGKIAKSKFAEYVSGVKETVRSLRGGNLWSIPGTDIKGSGLIKVGADGVRSEVITYYAKLPG